MVLVVPEVVRRKAEAAGAQAWLAELPGTVAELAREWSLQVGPAYREGTEALVAPVTVDGTSVAVLKVPVPQPGVAHEVTALRLADGAGCPRLLRYDGPRGALLLERLGPALHTFGYPLERRQDVLLAAVRRLWRPATGHGLPTGAEKGRWLAEFVVTEWERLGRPCGERAVDHAVRCAENRTRAHDDERAVLVHGDAHRWNALRSRDGFALVDPDGLLAEPEYDVGVLTREDPERLPPDDPGRWARRLAARAGLHPVAILEWSVVERLSTGLVCTAVGQPPDGRQLLAVCDRVAAAGV